MKNRRIPTCRFMQILLGLFISASIIRPLSAVTDLQQEMQRLVILENGRLKPLDTFARNLLLQLSGCETHAGLPAALWLARLLFAPEKSWEDKVFLVKSAEARVVLDLDESRRYFSFKDLNEHYDRLQQLVQDGNVSDRATTPLADEMQRLFHNFSQVYELNVSLKRSGESYSNSLLAIIPPRSSPGNYDETWHSPWDIIADAATADPEVLEMLEYLAQAAASYNDGQYQAAAAHLSAFNAAVRTRAGIKLARIDYERLYNRLHTFFIAQILYAAAFILLLFYLLLGRRIWYRLGGLLFGTGLLFHSGGLVLRLLITARAPVTNLYETFIFVAWIAALIGGVSEWRQKKNLGLLSGACAGFILLLISGRYALEGDTMGMLVAVLNTNLWLSVHVTTVTMGYSGCVIASIIGHVYIIQSLGRQPDDGVLEHSQHMLYATLGFGLVFTFLGTVMGGIWADQSWGRFWGWDPKENGALLIIVWVAIIFHSRRAGMIGPFGLAAGGVGAIITVVLAWFGVNLLGVGLHAYGFISGLNRALIAFLTLEILFLTGAAWLHWRRERR